MTPYLNKGNGRHEQQHASFLVLLRLVTFLTMETYWTCKTVTMASFTVDFSEMIFAVLRFSTEKHCLTVK